MSHRPGTAASRRRARTVLAGLLAATLIAACRDGMAETVPAPPTVAATSGLRVLVMGDELAAATGPVLAARLEALGTAEVEIAATPGLGLASGPDVPGLVARRASETGADVVVLQFGGQDTPPFALGADGVVTEPGAPAWYDRWSRQAGAVVDRLVDAGAVTYWVTTPPVADPLLDERAQAADLIVQALAHRRGDRVRTIDVRTPFVGPDGAPAVERADVALRAPGGYGLTPTGAEIAATAVAERLIADWCLDPDAAVHGCAPPALVPPSWPTAPGGADPLDVLVVGDSLLWQAAPALRAVLEASGARVWLEARPATGLLGETDWLGRLEELVVGLDPDVAVVQFMGQNARPDLVTPSGEPVDAASPAYVEVFASAAADAIDVLTSRGGRVAWVLGPPLAAERLDGTLRAIGLAVLARHGSDPAFVPVDLYTALGGPQGEYVEEVAGVRIRLFDGIHLTGEGARRNADAVVQALRAAGCLDVADPCPRLSPATVPQRGASTTTNRS